MQRTVRLRSHGRTQDGTLTFDPYQSPMLKVGRRGEIEFLDFRCVPRTPTTLRLIPENIPDEFEGSGQAAQRSPWRAVREGHPGPIAA